MSGPRERELLPTKEQIAAITDADAIAGLLDDVERQIAKMETDLEFAPGGEEWATRARAALSIHRYTERLLRWRLRGLSTRNEAFGKLASLRPVARPRERVVTDLDALALMTGDGLPDVEAITTVEEADAALGALLRRIGALQSERDSEVVDYEPAARDEAWLVLCASALKRAAGQRQLITQKSALLRRTMKLEVQRLRDADRQQAFIDAARALLPKATFTAIWDRVERLAIERESEAA